jgi:hypothetical protein
MVRIVIIVCALILAAQGTAFSQGILDSIFGAGGLGLWGSGDPSQFNPQQHYGTPQDAQMQQQALYGPGGYPQGYAPQGYAQQGYAPQGYGSQGTPGYYYPGQQGTYSDWQNYQVPPQTAAPAGPTPVRYTAPPGQAAAPQVQGALPAPAPVARGGAPLRPGQYAPNQPPQEGVEALPSGAVRITTTTPDGTTVQYYPPAGEPMEGQPAVRQPTRRVQPAGTTKPRRIRAREKTSSGAASGNASSVAMPRPVEIPQGQDPRSGWGPAVNRMPGPGPSR